MHAGEPDDDPVELPGRFGFRWASPSSWPLWIALVAVIAGWVLHVTINGVDYVALAAGGVAVVAAIIGVIAALVGRSGKQIAAGAVLMLLGLVHLWRSGLLGPGLIGLVGGPSDDDVRARLARDQNLTDVQVTPIGEGTFEFTGRRGHETCRGTVGIHQEIGSETASTTIFCALPDSPEALEAACGEGLARACGVVAARLHETSPRDWARLRTVSARGCSLSDATSCFFHGVVLETGQGGASEDAAGALRAYRVACIGGAAGGCLNEGFMLREGRGTATDFALAVQRFQTACDQHSDIACGALGEAYREGEGVPVDLARARTLFESACNGGHGIACTNFASMLLDEPGHDAARILALYQRACDHDSRVGCAMSGELLEDGRGAPADPAGALGFYLRACGMGHGSGCFSAGALLHRGAEGVPQDRAAALVRFERACELGDRVSCRNVAVYLRDGLAGPRDRERARTLMARSCELGDEQACRDARE